VSPSVADDGRPPGLAVRLLRGTFRHDEVAGGLPIGATCTEACRLTATLTIASGVFEGLQAGRGTAELGGRGATYVFVRLARGARRPLRRGRRVRLLLRVTATDAAGHRVFARRTVVFRR
ncbi:MAG: hypothetical protein M3389_02655, partial [Actinomycetota bacterium]|nr:hypothetical protein [Actinomycetota bacterium]